ncbi:MAG: BatD family protein [Planctomycetota bacterium]|nr:BatD family protein [Planctomycetota bacterium]
MARLFALLFALAALAPPPLFASAGQGRGEPRVTAQLRSGVVRLGDRTALVIEVEGTRRARILALPEVDGLALGPLPAPSTGYFTSFVNGRISELNTVTWAIPVRPQREGQFDIPPIELEIEGKRVRTRGVNLKVVADLRGEELGFLEIRASSSKVVEGQPFSIEVRFGWDASLRSINYADLSLPWWGQMPGTLELDSAWPPPGAKVIQHSVTVNSATFVDVEEIEAVDVGGRPYRILRLVRHLVATRPGLIEFPQGFLDFGRIESRIFGRREKTASHFVRWPEFYVEVVPLPEEGQPYDYTGAVGTLDVQATVDARDVDVGDSIKLEVEWTGDGNLEFFGPPDLARMEAFSGFRVYGSVEDKGFARRTVTYDLAPISVDVEEIPPVPLTVYDPELGSYVTVETEAIPIRVRPLKGAVELGSGAADFELDVRDIDARPVGNARAGSALGGLREPPPALVGATLVGVPLLWLGLRTRVRRRGAPDAPIERRRRRARKRLARDLARARTASDELAALHVFLAARSREADQAWVGRDPLAWLRANALGAPDVNRVNGRGEDAAARLAELIARLERSAYAEENGPVGGKEVLRVADGWIGGLERIGETTGGRA